MNSGDELHPTPKIRPPLRRKDRSDMNLKVDKNSLSSSSSSSEDHLEGIKFKKESPNNDDVSNSSDERNI
jgi:hypothetical protein